MDSVTLTKVLQASLSPNAADIKQSETQLSHAENQGAGQLLLTLMNLVFNAAEQIPVRQAAAIFSKNLLKRRWVKSEDDAIQHKPLEDSFKEEVRGFLLGATCGPSAVPQPKQVQSQINAIISFIADIDFPNRWPTLLPALVKTLQSSPSNELRLNALTCLCTVFRKYKTASRSTEVLLELKYLLPLFQEVHLELFRSVLPGIVSDPSGASSPEVFAAMDQIMEIFYSLNVVDIPEYYQDNVTSWMSGFLQILAIPTVSNRNTDEPGLVETLKTLSCENLSLYADKYQEAFEPFVGASVKAVWSLLVSLDLNENRFDLLVASGIRFLSSAANTRWTQSPFEEQEALVQICEKLILPNIQLRESDIELFSDNPDDYIRKDLQNADAETRRRSAVDLVKALSKFYESQVTDILVRYVQSLLGSTAQSNPRAKDACIQLVSAVAVKGETRAQGVTQVNPKVDVNQFFSTQLLPDLRQGTTFVTNNEERGLLVASGLKFIILFRSQLSKDLLNEALPFLIGLINGQSPKVVYCYAAHAVFLLSHIPVSSEVAAVGIKEALDIIASLGDQNEYLIKLVSRLVTHTSQPPAGTLSKLLVLVSTFSTNPVNAVFTHYMFESLGYLVAASRADSRESLIQPLCQLLDRNVMEYIPYALQVLSLLIESATLTSPVFSQLISLLMTEELWRNPSLVPGMVRIVSAYLFRADLFTPVLSGPAIASRVQLLLGTTKFEAAGFELVNAIFSSQLPTSEAIVQPLILSILTKIHQRRTERLIRSLGLSLACLVANPLNTPDILISVLEKIQPGLSIQVIKDLWMHAVSGLNANTMSPKHRKVYLVAIGKLLSSPNVQGNPVLAQAIVTACESMLLINPSKQPSSAPTTVDGEHRDGASGAEHEFEVSYARLVSTTNQIAEKDFYPQLEGDGSGALKGVLPQGGALAHWNTSI